MTAKGRERPSAQRQEADIPQIRPEADSPSGQYILGPNEPRRPASQLGQNVVAWHTRHPRREPAVGDTVRQNGGCRWERASRYILTRSLGFISR